MAGQVDGKVNVLSSAVGGSADINLPLDRDDEWEVRGGARSSPGCPAWLGRRTPTCR